MEICAWFKVSDDTGDVTTDIRNVMTDTRKVTTDTNTGEILFGSTITQFQLKYESLDQLMVQLKVTTQISN